MFLHQYELGCLSLYSYLIADETTGRAVVVDPQRDISGYLADADARGFTIERVLETHFHADFLSGHLELAAATGALISYGSVAQPEFAVDHLAHGQRLSLGQVELEIRHTPGHTPEGIAIVVRATPDAEPHAVLTGDTLFIGDVGRPDLLTSVGRTADSLAKDLYRSLHQQLLTLPDATLVYPAHGAGSSCGKNLSSAAVSTIGEQRATNYALRPMTEDEFVAVVTAGQTTAPRYFSFAAHANQTEHELLDDDEAPEPITAAEALRRAVGGAALIDTRSPETFASGHLRGSINVGLDGRFAEFAGNVIRPGQDVVVIGEPGTGTEAKVRLARIGFDAVVGEVQDIESVLTHEPALSANANRVTATDLAAWIADDRPQLIDVRNPGEVDDGSIDGAQNLPLATLLDHLDDLDRSAPTVVFCAGGYRSSIAASTLRAHGFTTVADLLGGFPAWASINAEPSVH